MVMQLGVVDAVVSPVDENLDVKVSGSKSNVTVHNIAVAMHDSNKVTENERSGDDNFVNVIDDDDDDGNPLIAIVGLVELLRWTWQLLHCLHLMRPLNL
jgi:hypothetical protein